jgi:hypothetical protein
VFYRLTILGILASILGLNLPVQGETCVPIPVVGGVGNQVTKTVSQPTIQGPFGVTITRNNWNTDWAIPGDVKFRHFVITIVPQETGEYTIQVYLKYSDQTSGQFYNSEGVSLPGGKPIIIKAEPRPEDAPYQVNVLVDGLAALGKTYTASVVGCQ